MDKSHFNTKWETEIYSQGKQCNRYPYDLVVSIVNRLYRGADVSSMKSLDIGCGTGNHWRFLADHGFDSHGIDGSLAAVQIAKSISSEHCNPNNLTVGDFSTLPYPDHFFDFALDRASVVYSPEKQEVFHEIYRVLKPGGYILSFMFDKDDPLNDKHEMAHCVSYNELLDIFGEFKIANISKHSSVPIVNNTEFIPPLWSEFVVLGMK